jgi:hypothetical protein
MAQPRAIWLQSVPRGVGALARELTSYPEHLLGTVINEGLPNEYVMFVDSNVPNDPCNEFNVKTWTAEFIVESVHELGQFVASGRLLDTDADILIRHLDRELASRL